MLRPECSDATRRPIDRALPRRKSADCEKKKRSRMCYSKLKDNLDSYDVANIFAALGLIEKQRINGVRKPGFVWNESSPLLIGNEEFFEHGTDLGGDHEDDEGDEEEGGCDDDVRKKENRKKKFVF